MIHTPAIWVRDGAVLENREDADDQDDDEE